MRACVLPPLPFVNAHCVTLCALLQTTFSLSTQMISAGPKLLYAPMLYASHKKRAGRKCVPTLCAVLYVCVWFFSQSVPLLGSRLPL